MVGHVAVLFFKLGSALATPLTATEFVILVLVGTLAFTLTVTWMPALMGFPLVQALRAPMLQVIMFPLIAQGIFCRNRATWRSAKSAGAYSVGRTHGCGVGRDSIDHCHFFSSTWSCVRYSNDIGYSLPGLGN